MLSAGHRLRRKPDFTRTLREGSRVRRGFGLVYFFPSSEQHPPKIGFVVSRHVGNAVVRHRLTRRLRHCASLAISRMPEGALLVARAFPGAADLSFTHLKKDFTSAVDKLLARSEQ